MATVDYTYMLTYSIVHMLPLIKSITTNQIQPPVDNKYTIIAIAYW